MKFVDLGTRNKPTAWEYLSAYSFVNTKIPNTKYHISPFFAFGEGEPNHHCHEKSQMKKMTKLMTKEFEKGIYTSSFFKKATQAYAQPLQKAEQIANKDCSNNSNKILAKKFAKASYAISHGHKVMLMALYTMYFDKYFMAELKKVFTLKERKNSDLILSLQSVLLITQKPTFPQLEENRIYELVKAYSKTVFYPEKHSFEVFIHQPKNHKKLQNLVKDFGWFHMEYNKDPFTEKDYKTYIWETIENERYKDTSPIHMILEAKRQAKEFFQTHKNAQRLKDLCRVLQEFAYLLDHTKMVVVKGIYTTRPLYQEAAKRLGATEDELRYLIVPEVVQLLNTNKKADKELIQARKKYRAIVLQNNTIRVYEGAKAKLLAKKYIKTPKISHQTQIKGIVGYPGIVTGRVGIVGGIDQRGSFKRGDILVTHDGTAELTVFLKEAAAIVTDQGGMICHAAIIAREMQTPCVLGTQIATKVFKDGDLVQVDAQRGIVRKLVR